MTDDDPSLIIREGAAAWNAWRAKNPGSLTFVKPNWYDSPQRRGKAVKGGNRVNFSGMEISGALILRAFAEGIQCQGTHFHNVQFEEGDFSSVNFRGATFRNTTSNKTIFTSANFDGATFVNCNLNRANFTGANFRVNEIIETVVYGISAWDIETSPDSKQSRLVIEKTYELYSDLIAQGKVPMTVDDIELAQFFHYLMNHKRLRDTLNVLNNRGVLLLGRFKNGGLERLYSIREWLQARGYMAMIFDFGRPENMDLIETVITMAGLAKFVIADLSGPRVGGELSAIFAGMHKPVFVFGDSSGLTSDVADKTATRMIQGDESNLMPSLEASLPELERLHADRIAELAISHRKIVAPPV
jgi:hypothetical protein